VQWANARESNVGWRIDTRSPRRDREGREGGDLHEGVFSDHAPVVVDYDYELGVRSCEVEDVTPSTPWAARASCSRTRRSNVHPGHKVGLVGPTARASRASSRSIRGELHADAGDVSMPPRWVLSHVAQETAGARAPARSNS
jgi:hypothetical protein